MSSVLEFIAAAVTWVATTLGANAATAAAVAAFAVKVVTAVALNAAMSALSDAFSPSQSQGFGLLDPSQFNTLRSDPLGPRMICYGQSAIAGDLQFQHLHADREWVSHVIQLADFGQDNNLHELVDVLIDGVSTSFDGAGNAIGAFAGNLKVRFYGGDWDQTADSALIANAPGKWTSNHRGRSCVYVVLEAKLSNSALFPAGLPTILFKLKGRRLYNPLLDSTFPGGSGTHRIDDETTWAWSNNAALVAFDFARGIKTNGHFVAGLRTPLNLIDFDWLKASIAACEAKGWTIDGFIPCDEDPGDVLKTMAQHMGGRIASRKGKVAIVAGYEWPALLVLGEDDLAGGLSLKSNRPWREAANAGRASFRDPNAAFGPVETNLFQVAAWIAEDNNQILERVFAAPFAVDFAQAARLLKVDLHRERAPMTIDAPWKLRIADAGEADHVWVRLPQYSVDAMFEVVARALDASGFVTLSLRQFDPIAAFTWNASEAGTAPIAGELDRSAPTPPTPTGFTVTGTTISSTAGAVPAAKVTGTPLTWVDGVVIEWRENGANQWNVFSDTRPSEV